MRVPREFRQVRRVREHEVAPNRGGKETAAAVHGAQAQALPTKVRGSWILRVACRHQSQNLSWRKSATRVLEYASIVHVRACCLRRGVAQSMAKGVQWFIRADLNKAQAICKLSLSTIELPSSALHKERVHHGRFTALHVVVVRSEAFVKCLFAEY